MSALGRAFARGFIDGVRQEVQADERMKRLMEAGGHQFPAIEVIEAEEVERVRRPVQCEACGEQGYMTLIHYHAGILETWKCEPMICCDTVREHLDQMAGPN